MPVFEYKCEDCGKVSEILIRKEGEKPVCSCGSSRLTKLFSAFAVSDGKQGHAQPACGDGCCGGQPSSPCSSGMCGL